MKSMILAAAAIAAIPAMAAAQRQVHVEAHTKSDGTYVPSHMRTAPNSTRNDNWSTIGNVNPHTGEAGTRPRDYGSNTPNSNSTYRPYTPRR